MVCPGAKWRKNDTAAEARSLLERSFREYIILDDHVRNKGYLVAVRRKASMTSTRIMHVGTIDSRRRATNKAE